jgi:hypothetical protein
VTAQANGRAPFDLDAARAAADEAESVPFLFTFGGQQYEVPPQGSWPMRAVSALARGDLPAALPQLLGPETIEALEDAGLTMGDLGRLFEAIGAGAGIGGLPNSSLPALPATTPT